MYLLSWMIGSIRQAQHQGRSDVDTLEPARPFLQPYSLHYQTGIKMLSLNIRDTSS